MNYALVITSCNNYTSSQNIIRKLLDHKLIACGTVVKSESYYFWEGGLTIHDEYMLILKTLDENYKEVEEKIINYHPYDLPEVIKVSIEDGYKEYLNWIDKNCRK